MKILVPGKHENGWKAEIVCDQDGSCGAILEIDRNDLFSSVQPTGVPDFSRELAQCLCPCCGDILTLETTRNFGELPDRQTWALHHATDIENARSNAARRADVIGVTSRFYWP